LRERRRGCVFRMRRKEEEEEEEEEGMGREGGGEREGVKERRK